MVYAFGGFAPPADPGSLALVVDMFTFNLSAVNPAVFAVFMLMGVWPLVYACLLLNESPENPVPGLPFVFGSFGLGAFVLLPYLGLRQPEREFSGVKWRYLKGFDSRVTGIVLAILTTLLVLYGGIAGDWAAYVEAFQTTALVHVMSWDFLVLAVLAPYYVWEDMHRRDGYQRGWFLLYACVPLFGPLGYLVARPPLPARDSES